MEKSSRVIENTPGLSRNAIRTKVGGKREYGELALELLVNEGYVRVEAGNNRANLHHSDRPYRALDDPAAQVGPGWGPSEAGLTGTPVGPSGALPTEGPHPGPHPHGRTR